MKKTLLAIILLAGIFLLWKATRGKGPEESLADFSDGMKAVTVEEFLRAEVSDEVWYRLTGEILSIGDYKYGNLYLGDGTGEVYVYGLTASRTDHNDQSFKSLDLEPGDMVSIACHRGKYKDNDEATDAWFLGRAKGVSRVPDKTEARDGSPQAGWMELPAMSESEKENFHTHFMDSGGREARSYSYTWDSRNMVAKWAAYPLTRKDFSSNRVRSDAWGYDPLMPSGSQPLLAKGYRDGNAGYHSRGHQIPSADRLASYNSNSQTFYYTNMTPQMKGFNAGIWNTLESAVRSWARSCDTLYVVSGCITKNSTKYCYDNKGKKVTVPTGYYKALLALNPNAGGSHSGYRAAGFYLDHKEYPVPERITRDMSMSIDELEEKTGIDFFALLAGKVGKAETEKIESEDPSTIYWWWR